MSMRPATDEPHDLSDPASWRERDVPAFMRRGPKPRAAASLTPLSPARRQLWADAALAASQAAKAS